MSSHALGKQSHKKREQGVKENISYFVNTFYINIWCKPQIQWFEWDYYPNVLLDLKENNCEQFDRIYKLYIMSH